MKHSFLLFSAACMLLTGCAESSVPEEPLAHHTNPVRTESVTAAHTDTGTETQCETAPESEPTELEKRIAAIYDLKPVPVPEEGWTDETLLPVISVAGKPMQMPVPLSELLFGYKTAGENADYYASCADRIFTDSVWLAGDGIVLFSVFGDESIPADMLPSTMQLEGDWAVCLPGDSTRPAFTVNCIGIGSMCEELTNQLGTPEINEGNGLFRLEIRTESVCISVRGSDETVRSIAVRSVK